MLAGHKLLLADDSITIQKVVDLTFADEGVEVISVGNGKEAIERVQEIAPDIVLADVFMPEVNGYQVCKYIKENEKLKHIPVMLLVGSFEPFDEAEARRVGADDILTKPFQSIRRLIDKVGGLLGGKQVNGHGLRPDEEEIPTAELTRPEAEGPQLETLTDQELEITTADTRPLAAEVKSLAMQMRAQAAQRADVNEYLGETLVGGKEMVSSNLQPESVVTAESVDDVLMDLGDFQSADEILTDEYVLDLGIEATPEPSAVEAGMVASDSAFAESASLQWSGVVEDANLMAPSERVAGGYSAVPKEYSREMFAGPGARDMTTTDTAIESPQPIPQSAAAAGKITLDQLSPEVIDAIAKRAVERLSEKEVQEIAWEVVPQLAELLIKRQLEQKKT